MSNKYYNVAEFEKKQGYKFELIPNYTRMLKGGNGGNADAFLKITDKDGSELSHSTFIRSFGFCQCHRPSDPKGFNRRLLIIVTESGKYLLMDYDESMANDLRSTSAVEVDRKTAIDLVTDDFVTSIM